MARSKGDTSIHSAGIGLLLEPARHFALHRGDVCGEPPERAGISGAVESTFQALESLNYRPIVPVTARDAADRSTRQSLQAVDVWGNWLRHVRALAPDPGHC